MTVFQRMVKYHVESEVIGDKSQSLVSHSLPHSVTDLNSEWNEQSVSIRNDSMLAILD